MSVLFLVTLIVVCDIVGVSGLGTVCFENTTEFEIYCNALNGYVVMGRCFFVTSPDTWDNGFARCADHGAYFAQIHTDVELTAFTNRYKTADKTDYWIAMKRDYANQPGATSMVLMDTFYFNDPINRNSDMHAGKMWVRTHENDDTSANESELCFYLYSRGVPKGTFLDGTCSDVIPVLCSITNLHQEFISVPGAFLAEGIIQALSSSSVEYCAKACSSDIQCRGFDVSNDSGLYHCYLSSWYYNDYTESTYGPQYDHFKFFQ